MNIKDELWDYTICLENAARVIHKKSERKDFKIPEQAIERNLMDKEVETIKRIYRDLKGIVESEEKGTYWDYLNENEGDK